MGTGLWGRASSPECGWGGVPGPYASAECASRGARGLKELAGASPEQGLGLGAADLGPKDLVLGCRVGHSAPFGLPELGDVCVTV